MSVAQYDKMWIAYQEKQTTEHVRRKVVVAWRTAEKYITKGDPSRGLKPLRDRYAQAMEKGQRIADYSISRAHAETVTLIRMYKMKLGKRIETIKFDDMSAAIGSELDRVSRLEEDILTKSPPREQTTEAMFDGWTDKELKAFAKTGKRPKRIIAEEE